MKTTKRYLAGITLALALAFTPATSMRADDVVPTPECGNSANPCDSTPNTDPPALVSFVVTIGTQATLFIMSLF